MFDSCVPVFPPKFTLVDPNNTDPLSYTRIVAITAPPLGLYTPTFVRNVPVNPNPLAKFVNTVTACAEDESNPGINIPTDPTVPAGHGGEDAGEYNRDVTTKSLVD